jgi:agmatine deiminase
MANCCKTYADLKILFIVFFFVLISSCKSKQDEQQFIVTSEFEEQEYIWLGWMENKWLAGEPLYLPIIETIKEIHPYVKVKLMYGPQMNFTKEQLQTRIYDLLLLAKVDTARVEMFYNVRAQGAIQDPGPVFLRNIKGELAVADFQYQHPDKLTGELDKNAAIQMNLPVISSDLFSEGGAWQTNGEGTMLLVESVELDRNKKMSKEQIEKEYKRVLGVIKIIWLKKGCKEEEWKKLEDGKYGIGTGGHIDEFCRFVNPSTVLLAQVNIKDTVGNETAKESYRRMEENYGILKQSSTLEGKPIEIIRLPAGPMMTSKMHYNSLSKDEQSWFENVSTDSIEYYIATSYMNFVIANKVIVTAKFWKEGLPDELKKTDEEAKAILEKAFPGRNIVQIDCMPLHHEGAGIHCYSRNQPFSKKK